MIGIFYNKDNFIRILRLLLLYSYRVEFKYAEIFKICGFYCRLIARILGNIKTSGKLCCTLNLVWVFAIMECRRRPYDKQTLSPYCLVSTHEILYLKALKRNHCVLEWKWEYSSKIIYVEDERTLFEVEVLDSCV